jgi:hypothetical protein
MDPYVDRDKAEKEREQFQAESGRDPFESDMEFANSKGDDVTKPSYETATDVYRSVDVEPDVDEVRLDDYRSPADRDTEFGMDAPMPLVRTAGERRVIEHGAVDAEREQDDVRARQGDAIAWISLLLGIASLFFWQAVLGPAAIITGIFAWVRGSRTMGTWAIVLGLIAVVAYFVLVPYYA